MINWLTTSEAAKLAGITVRDLQDHIARRGNVMQRGEARNGRLVVTGYDASGIIEAFHVVNWKVRLMRIDLDRTAEGD